MPKIIITSLLSLIFLSNAMAATSTTNLLQQGQDFYQRGDFAQAIDSWQIALDKTQQGSQERFNTLIRLAVAYQKVGNSYSIAYSLLNQAVAESHGITARQVLIYSYLGDLLLVMQSPDAAKKLFEEQLPLARTLGNSSRILATFLNNFGNVLSVDQEYTEALKLYQQVADIAEHIDDIALQIQALSNQARAHFKLGTLEASTAMKKALSLVYQQPDSHDKAFELLSLGELALRFQNNSPERIKIQTYPIFMDALRLAKQYQATRLLSYTKGLLGQLYESQQRYPDALLLTSEAKFFAQAFPDLLYLWEWQQARLLLALKDLDGALAAYQRTIVYLQPIRTQLSVGQRDRQEVFYERIRPVYYGFADALLQQAQATSSPPQKAKWLNQARDIIEQLKAAELENYFQKDCVFVQTPIALLDNLIRQKNTAVFYPVLLSERTELLLSLPDGIHQIIIPVRYDILKETVLEFRRNLQRTAKGSFINQAKQLYQWLIAPLMAKLVAHNINTLVIVPDSFLRIIPMAALYDAQEKQFLYQRFALATTPGLTLTEPQALERHQVKVLLNGLSEGVQGFPPLPSVIKEINTINKVFTQSTVLIDKAFSLNSLNDSLQSTPYQIVHISSHGQFDRNPKESFLLTYDDKLTMDRLEKLFQLSDLRSEKVELLTLSACQTAVGDERAALGLAGVAIKAGARSALASLWFVDDEATSQLIAEFYQQLQNPALSKAQALQNAQKKLAKKRKFRHPAYWAPFLLIGNWL